MTITKNLGKAMNVDIYLRKSRMEEQSDATETLQRHRDTLFKLADSLGLNVGEVFEEVVSGESLYSRPQMLALLEKVEHGSVDAILCMDIDRLGRGGMRDQGIILEVFKGSNTKIITPDHTYDLNDENDEQLTEFKSFFARQEYKQITKRLRRGILHTIRDGGYIANAPFGYKKATVNKKPTLEIDEGEAKYVRMIFNMYCAGNGCTSIANMLNGTGVRPRRSDHFCRNTVLNIIKNPVYTGKIVWNRTRHIRKGTKGADRHRTIYNPEDSWIVVEGIHEPIISEELFERAQEISRSRYIPPSNDGTVKSPLAGLVRCGRCGMNMQRMLMHKEHPYLLCNTTACCAGAKFVFVENRILAMLKDKLDELQALTGREPEQLPYEELCAGIQSEITKAQAQKNRLHDLLEQGLYDIGTYRERMKVISDRLDELKRLLEETQAEIVRNKRMDHAELKERIVHALEVYDTLDAKGRNQLLKSFVDYIDYFKAKKSKPNDFELQIFYK